MLADGRSELCSIWQFRGELLPFRLSPPRPHSQPVRAGEWRAGGREGRRAEGGGGAEGRRALGCEIGGGKGGESPSWS